MSVRRAAALLVAVAAMVAACVWTCAPDVAGPHAPESPSAGDADPPDRAAPAPPGRGPRTRAATRAQGADGVVHADDLAEAAAGVVRGVVEDEAGAPVAGAVVRSLDVTDRSIGEAPRDAVRLAVRPSVAEMRSGADGSFAFEIAGGAPWRVVVDHEPFQVWSTVGAGPADLGDVMLRRGEQITVSVEDDAGTPIPDAEGFLFTGATDNEPSARIKGDREGNLRLRVSESAWTRLVVTAPGYTTDVLAPPRDGDCVQLGPGLDVGGRVEDERGAPVPEAIVVTEEAPQRVAVTDTDGRFRLPALGADCGREGQTIVVLVKGRSRHEAAVLPGDLDARIVLRDPVTVRGVVVFEDGTPAAWAPVNDAVTDADGRFEVRVPAAPQSLLSAAMEVRIDGADRPITTAQSHVVIATDRGAPPEPVRIVLRRHPMSFARIAVEDPEGAPFRVAVLLSATSAREQVSKDGVWWFGVEPGTPVRVRAADPTSRRWSPSAETTIVTAAAPPADPVVLRLRPLLRLPIRVVDAAGAVVPPQDVVRVWSRVTSTTVEGRELVTPAGSWVQITVEMRGGAVVDWSETVPYAGAREVTVVVPAQGSVRGRLLRRDGGAAEGLYVSIHAAGTPSAVTAPTPGADGRFRLAAVRAGRAQFWATNESGRVAAARTIDVPPDGEIDLGDVVVWDEVGFEGVVKGPDGEPVPGAIVELAFRGGADDAYIDEVRLVTDVAGRFARAVPAAGRGLLVVTRPGRLACVRAVDVSAPTRLDLVLARSGALRVEVAALGPSRSWDVLLVRDDAGVRWDPDGTNSGATWWSAPDVPEGPWTVVVTNGGAERRRDVVVSAGAETIVRFE